MPEEVSEEELNFLCPLMDETRIPNDKYKIMVLLDSRTPENIIHTYKVYNGIRALEQFVKINDTVWWFGASIYTLRLFVNMTTGKAFMPDGDDVDNSSHNFITSS
jgi:hypothetical protein